MTMIQELKKCNKCGLSLSVENFDFRRDTNKYRNYCKNCRREPYRNKAFYERLTKEIENKQLKEQGLRRCNKCGTLKDLSCFSYRKDTKTYRNNCKYCIKEASKDVVKNYTETHKEDRKSYGKDYRLKNKQKLKSASCDYYNKNKESISKKAKFYNIRDRDKTNARRKNRRKTNEKFVVAEAMRRILKRSFDSLGVSKLNTTSEVLGYTPSELHSHLNKGKYTINDYIENRGSFHLDHIIPIDYFVRNINNINNNEEIQNALRKANSIENLIIIKAEDNLSKKDKIDYELIEKHNLNHLL